MNHQDLKQRLPGAIDTIVKSVHAHENIQHLGRVSLPNRDAVIEAVGLLRQIMFPGYFGKQGLTEQAITYRIGELVVEVAEILYEQISASLCYKQSMAEAEKGASPGGGAKGQSVNERASEVVWKFLERIPAVRELLASDVEAAIEGDPAAKDADETIFCYPGVYAIMTQRLAHELWKLEVPLLPRIMTEHAHSETGIDIHPAAKIGRRFFIDHGTGVVIGETSVIGNNVRIYQGVTLGGLVLTRSKTPGEKRHPTIEDDVTIFSGATILGGETVIGKGAIISGNVFITTSIPPMKVVHNPSPKLDYYSKPEDAKTAFHFDI
jgi:serine O-acetyltransferase